MANDITKLIFDLKGLEVHPAEYMRFALTGLLPEVRKRIHVQGEKASGAQIGTYSNAYLKLRSGNYGNSAKFSRGAKKGQNKNSGNFTKGSKEGQTRPNYNRGSDPKVILSLTRQMEQDFVVIADDNVFGLGFNNPDNYNKAKWNDQRYKDVYQLSETEKQLAEAAIQEYIDGLLGSNS